MPVDEVVVTRFVLIQPPTMKKTMLLAASGPGLDGVGGILIRDMLVAEGREPIYLAALLSEANARKVDSAMLAGFKRFDPPHEFFPKVSSRLDSIHHLGRRFWFYDRIIRQRADEIRAYLAETNPDQLWVILNSLAVLDIVYRLLPAIKAELLVQVWDDPEHLARQRRLDRFSRQRTYQRFIALLRRSRRTAVICEEMASAYANLHPGSYIIVRHGVEHDEVKPRPEASSPHEFRIGFSGSLYSPAGWKALLAGLDELQWRLDSRQVVLVTMGGKIEFISRSTADCRFLGRHPPEEALRMMTDCDLLYLPQAFEAHLRPLSQLSFPTKLSAYAATGRPVLVHAPEYGSLSRFCRQHGAGILCHSLNAGEIAGLLKRCEDFSFRQQHASAMARIGSQVLTRQDFNEGVRAFLGTA